MIFSRANLTATEARKFRTLSEFSAFVDGIQGRSRNLEVGAVVKPGLMRHLPIGPLMCLLALVPATSAVAQTAPARPAGGPDKADPIYAVVDEVPAFPGGQPALRAYLMESLEFPAEALDAPADGPVQITFIVRKDGQITDATVVKGQHPALDAEALRLVTEMPPWEPGRHHGKAVSTLVSLPIRFAAPRPAELVQTPTR